MMLPRSKYFILLSISIFLFSLFQFLPSTTPSLTRSPYSAPKKKPVHLLVVSSWRSGSSFLGQIFNHHGDVFYLFEPGHSVWMKLRGESLELLHYPLRDLLRSLFTCDVSPLQQYLPKGGKYISEMGFFAESRALCTPPACSAFLPSEGYDRLSCYHRCKNTLLDKMAETCKAYSHVVMKTVRILDLSVLLPLFRDPNLDLRILHLVRDPRAIALSKAYFPLQIEDRIVLKNEENTNITISRVMEKICRSQVDINSVPKAAEVLKGRYLAIRHEDLANEPLKNVKKIYNFAGLQPTKDLEQWIYNITHKEVADYKGFMTFSRDSSKTVQRWRTALGFSFVNQIQEKCKAAMDLFGYRPAKSQKEQKNLTLELVKKDWSLE
ncbi:PREDICTED: carbohydrate sulfotransferase 6-like [Nanorana parkeri]|uniref:carbohydrate sulfotransferase 6-like n=1 Tax=Nanorana parkeri TaxID=125878 RepID=UPI000854AA23|nr:PREDICTED: carbohydrate sulfotransferase 6-like [Nanorana parkeri]